MRQQTRSWLREREPELADRLEGCWNCAFNEWLPAVKEKKGSFNSYPHLRNLEMYLDDILFCQHPRTGRLVIEELKLTSSEVYVILCSILFHDLGHSYEGKDKLSHACRSRQTLAMHYPELGLESEEVALCIGRIAHFHDPDERGDGKAEIKRKSDSGEEQSIPVELRDVNITGYGSIREGLLGALMVVIDHLDGTFTRTLPSYVRVNAFETIGKFRSQTPGIHVDFAARMVVTTVKKPVPHGSVSDDNFPYRDFKLSLNRDALEILPLAFLSRNPFILNAKCNTAEIVVFQDDGSCSRSFQDNLIKRELCSLFDCLVAEAGQCIDFYTAIAGRLNDDASVVRNKGGKEKHTKTFKEARKIVIDSGRKWLGEAYEYLADLKKYIIERNNIHPTSCFLLNGLEELCQYGVKELCQYGVKEIVITDIVIFSIPRCWFWTSVTHRMEAVREIMKRIEPLLSDAEQCGCLGGCLDKCKKLLEDPVLDQAVLVDFSTRMSDYLANLDMNTRTFHFTCSNDSFFLAADGSPVDVCGGGCVLQSICTCARNVHDRMMKDLMGKKGNKTPSHSNVFRLLPLREVHPGWALESTLIVRQLARWERKSESGDQGSKDQGDRLLLATIAGDTLANARALRKVSASLRTYGIPLYAWLIECDEHLYTCFGSETFEPWLSKGFLGRLAEAMWDMSTQIFGRRVSTYESLAAHLREDHVDRVRMGVRRLAIVARPPVQGDKNKSGGIEFLEDGWYWDRTGASLIEVLDWIKRLVKPDAHLETIFEKWPEGEAKNGG